MSSYCYFSGRAAVLEIAILIPVLVVFDLPNSSLISALHHNGIKTSGAEVRIAGWWVGGEYCQQSGDGPNPFFPLFRVPPINKVIYQREDCLHCSCHS